MEASIEEVLAEMDRLTQNQAIFVIKALFVSEKLSGYTMQQAMNLSKCLCTE